jgi:glc operon protein GlcG
MRTAILGIVAAGLTVSAAGAQTPRAELDYRSAAAIRDGCIAWAAERQLTVSVAVLDRHGTLIASGHMDGAPAAVGDIAQWKGRSAARMQVATGVTAKWGGSAPGIANWRGGVPFKSPEGAPLGGVGTSGATGQQDEDCGKAGIAAARLVAGETE